MNDSKINILITEKAQYRGQNNFMIKYNYNFKNSVTRINRFSINTIKVNIHCVTMHVVDDFGKKCSQYNSIVRM